MCGIAGVYCDGDAPGQGDLECMVHAMRRRGPDDRGYFLDGPVGVGMCRLAIIDPEHGRQPLFSEDGNVVVVCNGEIYNHAELRAELEAKGHRFKTHSDAESIVHLYEEEGLNCLERLQGMFGLAIWDLKRHRLVIARDRLGIKPLYYATNGNALIFGSELKAVLAPGRISTTIDPSAVDAYFKLGYIPNPLTIYKEISKLPPAHVLVHERGKTRVKRYWRLSFEPKPEKPLTQWLEEFVSLFRETVKKHLMSDVPLGAFLSGGIDSSYVVASMAQYVAPVQTFTVGFAGSVGGYLDERGFAQDVSRRFGTHHTEFEVWPRPEDIIDEVVEAFDEPFADDSVIPSYYLCQETSKRVKVALSGLGGDELFAGYERYLGLVWSSAYGRVPAFVKNSIIAPIVNRLPEQRNGHYAVNHLKRFVRNAQFPPAERYQRFVSIFQDEERDSLLSERGASLHNEEESPYFSTPNRGILDHALQQDVATYLPEDILALSDRLSMWHGLELRVPFVDHKLVEFCATMPASLKIRGREKKVLLRKASKGVLPDSVLSHRKQGFAAPMAAWLRGDLKEYVADSLSPATVGRSGYVDANYVQTLLQDHWDRRELNDRKIFSVLMFQRWMDRSAAIC